ncbi:hypothetical protein A2U01_0024927, partial [Trifolium medium]|nr:hypothetical protein [Trifolium medium]
GDEAAMKCVTEKWRLDQRLVTVSELWHFNFFSGFTSRIYNTTQRPLQDDVRSAQLPSTLLPPTLVYESMTQTLHV